MQWRVAACAVAEEVLERVGHALEAERDGTGKIRVLQQHGDITTDYRVTPDLIGGLRITLGSNVWDGSVKARLNALRTALLS